MHVDGRGLLEHRPGVREHLHLAAGITKALGGGLQMLAVQRQQTHHGGLAGQCILDPGVDEVDLIQLAGLEVVDGVHRDVAGALQGGRGGTVAELFHQTRVLVVQCAVTYLTDHIEPVVLIRVLLEEPEDVLVECTGHALVCRQHQIGAAGVRLFVGTVVEERVHRLLRQMRHHPGDGVAHAVEVGRNVLVILARLAELGRGDQVHGVRDLHGVLNALNALFQQLTGRHGCRLPHMLSRRSGWHRPHRVRACRWR